MHNRLAPKQLLTIPEFSREYGLSRSRVYDELREGRLVGKKLGRKTLISRANADAWAAALPDYDPAEAIRIAPRHIAA